MEWSSDFQVSVWPGARSGPGVPDRLRVIVELYRLTLDREIEKGVGERNKDRASEKIWRGKSGTEFVAKIVRLPLITE